MNILDSYVSGHVAKGYALILLVFLSLFSFFVFVEEIGKVGKGTYHLLDAVSYVAMTTPGRMVYLAPFTALLGSIVALGKLASTQELVAMEALGISPRRIAWTVIQVGILFSGLTVVIEEWVAPPLEQKAHIQRSLAISGSHTLQSQNGFWLRDDLRYIKVGKIRYGEVLENIDIYQFNPQGQLLSTTHAQEAILHTTDQWMLKDIRQNIITKQKVSVQQLDTLAWDTNISPEEIHILTLPPETLPPSDLYYYIEHLKKNGQNYSRQELIFWEKLGRPFAAGVMVFLAIPSVFGPLRGATMGKRILIGSGLGMAFYLTSQVFGQVGLFWNLHPSGTTLTPIVGTLIASLWLWRRL